MLQRVYGYDSNTTCLVVDQHRRSENRFDFGVIIHGSDRPTVDDIGF
jgi:hypothetical protein